MHVAEMVDLDGAAVFVGHHGAVGVGDQRVGAGRIVELGHVVAAGRQRDDPIESLGAVEEAAPGVVHLAGALFTDQPGCMGGSQIGGRIVQEGRVDSAVARGVGMHVAEMVDLDGAAVFVGHRTAVGVGDQRVGAGRVVELGHVAAPAAVGRRELDVVGGDRIVGSVEPSMVGPQLGPFGGRGAVEGEGIDAPGAVKHGRGDVLAAEVVPNPVDRNLARHGGVELEGVGFVGAVDDHLGAGAADEVGEAEIDAGVGPAELQEVRFAGLGRPIDSLISVDERIEVLVVERQLNAVGRAGEQGLHGEKALEGGLELIPKVSRRGSKIGDLEEGDGA